MTAGAQPLAPGQPVRIAFIRVFIWLIGVSMAFELVGGKYPKFNMKWANGQRLTELANGVLEGSTWGPIAWTLESVIIPNAAVLSLVVTLTQTLIVLSFLSGLFVRLVAVAGIPMFIGMNVFVQTVRTPHWYITGLLVIVMTYPAAMFGIDRLVSEGLQGIDTGWARRLRSWVAPDFSSIFSVRRRFALLIGSLVGLAALGLLHMALLDQHVLRLTMLEAVAFTGLVTAAAFLHRSAYVSVDELAVALMRFKAGLAVLWPIFANRSVKITGLPGFADRDKMASLLTDVVGGSHWPPLAYLARQFLAPNVDAFVIVTGLVQLAIGLAFVLGVQLERLTRLSVVYFAVVCVIGFTRTTQYALVFSIIILALGGGWGVSVDRLLDRPRPVVGLPHRMAAGLALLSFTAVLMLTVVPLSTNPYDTNVAGAVFLTLVVTLAPLAIVLVGFPNAGRDNRSARPARHENPVTQPTNPEVELEMSQ